MFSVMLYCFLHVVQAENAKTELLDNFPDSAVSVVQLDVSSFTSVCDAANELKQR